MNKQMMGIEREIQSYLKQIEAYAIKERKRIKSKLQGTKRFMLTHITNVL